MLPSGWLLTWLHKEAKMSQAAMLQAWAVYCANHASMKDRQILSFPREKHRRARALSVCLTAVSRGPGKGAWCGVKAQSRGLNDAGVMEFLAPPVTSRTFSPSFPGRRQCWWCFFTSPAAATEPGRVSASLLSLLEGLHGAADDLQPVFI